MVVKMKSLLEAGVHFGHQSRRLDPRMKPYVFTERNGIHVIDLQKTSKCLDAAYFALKDIADKGGKVLFVGTKKQAQAAIKAEAERCGMFYINHRWLGGTLTNFETIRRSIDNLKLMEDAELEKRDTFTKKEIAKIKRKREKLLLSLEGIRDMVKLPQAIFIADTGKDMIAIKEAKKLNIPVFAIVDTNCDPTLVDHIIPANDDAVRSIAVITNAMANAVLEVNQVAAKLEGSESIEDVKAMEEIEKKEISEEPIKEVKVDTEAVTESSEE